MLILGLPNEKYNVFNATIFQYIYYPNCEGETVLTTSPRQRLAVIAAALLALFLGAMDALVVSAAMPTIVAELGGLHLYSWVYSSYFLAKPFHISHWVVYHVLGGCRLRY